MKQHWPKLLIVALLAAVVGLPLVLRAVVSTENDTSNAVTAQPADRLVIYTPHSEAIRYEFAHGFNRWREKQGLPPINFDWRASGGTSDLRKQVLSQYKAAADRQGLEAVNQGVGADLFFGGGEYEHNQLASGIQIKADKGQDESGEGLVTIDAPVVQPFEISENELETIFPSPTLAGHRLYQKDRLWMGTVLASFGIVYNRDVLTMKGLDEPRTWSDLTAPPYRDWIALADPAHSGSITATYNTILRRKGWAQGWAMLRRVFANSRYFTASASKVPVDVSAGEAAAGMCIDFYGRYQAGAVDQGEAGPSRVGYVDPKGLTATTADPISILRGAPHAELANSFVRWTLTETAQRLWQRKLGSEGGPAKFELRRQPIRSSIYTPTEKAHWTDPQISPFKDARPVPKGMPDFYGWVAPIAHAIAIDIHDELNSAWTALLRTPDDDPNKPEMLAAFNAMPKPLQINWPNDALARHWRQILGNEDHPQRKKVLSTLRHFKQRLEDRWDQDKNQQLKDRLAWTTFFRKNYQRVVKLAP